MSGSTQGGLPLWHGLMAQGLRMALLLGALTQLIHAAHFSALEPLNRYATEWLMEARSGYAGMNDRPDVAPDSLRIQNLELDAALRAEYLEPTSLDTQALRRLGGIRPIDREQLAKLLDGLSDCLAGAKSDSCLNPDEPDKRPMILAIDIDLAPRESDTTMSGEKVVTSLQALSKQIQLLLIALPRSDAIAQERRNAFMRRLCEPNAATLDARRIAFASPLLLREADSTVREYPGPSKNHHGAAYPSVGGLIQYVFRTVSAPVAARSDTSNETTPHTKPPLDLCQLVPAPGAANPSLPLIDHDDWAGQYRPVPVDWRHMDSPALAFVPLLPPPNRDTDWIESAVQQIRAQKGLSAPVLLLSADGGGAVDRFRAPGSSSPISGAQIHAVQALSVSRPLHEPTWGGLGLDLLMGGLMTLLAATFHTYFLHPINERHWPGMKPLLAALSTLAIALLTAHAGMELAAYLSHRGSDLWVNPTYLILGLGLHAYAETQSPHPEPRPTRETWLKPLIQLLPPDCRPGRAESSEACTDRWACFFLQWTVLGGALLVLLNSKH